VTSLDAIKRELNSPLPNDRVGGLLTLAQERWLVEQLEATSKALDEYVRRFGLIMPTDEPRAAVSIPICVCRHEGDACSAPDHRPGGYPASREEPQLLGPDPDGPLFPDEWGDHNRGL
jgi:hypothetical protein